MIEISHKQARYLIREVEDRRLPEEQWAALQAHLERCAECRAYQQRIAGINRDLRRMLHQHWNTVNGPAAELPAQVLAQRAARGRRSHRAVFALCGLLFFLALIGLQWRAQVASPAPTQAAALPTITPTPALQFRGLVLFESSHFNAASGNTGGDTDVFLLNSTGAAVPELSNLTNDPSHDSDPIWSPDGEWVAFLSDRSGKRELYTISVAGTRLTQLTADPEIDWEGPLSWSADGKWIALAGRRLSQDGDRWGYLVPLLGGRPVSLPGTRSMAGKMQFSPTQPLLATQDHIFNIDDGWSFEGWYGLKGEEDLPDLLPQSGQAVDFDWTTGGSSLGYLGRSQNGLTDAAVFDQIRLSPVIGLNNRQSLADERSQLINSASGEPAFRSLGYMPGGPYLATLRDAYNTGCWTVRLINAFHYRLLDPIDLPRPCVDSPIERASWSPAGPSYITRWLVVAGHLENPPYLSAVIPPEPGIYAIQTLPKSSSTEPVPEFERLLDLPAGLPAGAIPIPRLRPAGASLNIQPQAVRQVKTASPGIQLLPPSLIADGMLVAGHNVQRPGESTISVMRDDGLNVIAAPEGAHDSCPSRSPDGQKIAYRSNEQGQASGIFVLNVNGSLQSPVGEAEEDGAGGPSGEPATTYGCPVWSPDSQSIAAVRFQGDVTRLVVMDSDNGEQTIFAIDSPSQMARPVWSPNGKTIYLAETSARISSAYLVAVSWSTLTGPTTMRVLSGWDDVHAMALSPDGKQMALIAVQNETEDDRAQANLFILDMVVQGAGVRVRLPAYDPRAVKTPGRIAWLRDDRILFAQPAGPLHHDKATLLAFDTQDGSFVYYAYSADALFDWGYRDNWLFYSSESGLWAQNVLGSPGVPPTRLSSQVISSLELK